MSSTLLRSITDIDIDDLFAIRSVPDDLAPLTSTVGTSQSGGIINIWRPSN